MIAAFLGGSLLRGDSDDGGCGFGDGGEVYMSICLNDEDFGTLAICAIRYCHGRETYMPDLVRGIIKPHLSALSDKDIGVLIDDCRFQKKMELWGDERIDKPGWVKWAEELKKEKERRAKG